MKRCPQCGRTFTDMNLTFCLYDGKPLELVVGQPTQQPTVQPQMGQPPIGQPLPSQQTPYPAAPMPPKDNKRSTIVAVTAVIGIMLAYTFLQHRTPNTVEPGRTAQPTVGTNQPVAGTNQPEPVTPGAEPTPTVPTENPPPALGGTAKDTQTAILKAIVYSDAAEVIAEKTLNTMPLYRYFDGTALTDELKKIENLKSRGVFAVNNLEKQQFQDVQVSPDGNQATVKVVETWSSIYYSTATKQQTGTKPSEAEPQTMTLTLKNGEWIVTEDKPQ